MQKMSSVPITAHFSNIVAHYRHITVCHSKSILLLIWQVSSGMYVALRWRKWAPNLRLGGRGRCTEFSVLGVAGWECWARSTHASVSASQQQTLSGRGARVYTCTCVHDNIPCRRFPTLPGPSGPAHTSSWLGVVMASGDMRQRVAPFECLLHLQLTEQIVTNSCSM